MTVYLDEMTDPEVANFLEKGGDLLLVPTGATEQHGPHAPLGTDVIIPREVCRRVALEMNALVAPPLAYGISAAHRGFRGLAYVRPTTFIQLVKDLIFSFAEAGFKRICFINGHYTNYPAINMAAFEAADDIPGDVHAFAMSYWDALPPEELEAYLSMNSGLHANIGETSAVMAVRPELVKLERAVEGWPSFPDFKGPSVLTVFAHFETRPGMNYRAMPEGVWGDPRGSSAELGETFYRQITQAVRNVIEDIGAARRSLDLPNPGSKPLATRAK